MPRPVRVASRVILALAGGYVTSSVVLTVFCILAVASGMSRGEAVTLGMMLVFVLYLALILWPFAARILWPVGLVFALLIAAGYGTTLLAGHGG